MAAPVTIVDANGHANSSTAPQYIATPTPAAVKAGQYKLTATAASITGGTAVALLNGATLKAPSTNVGTVIIGATGVTETVDGTGNGFLLESGDSVYLAVANLASVFAIGTADDVVTWLGN